MPGKVNPTQSEAVTMVCVKVIGNHNGIQWLVPMVILNLTYLNH